ncbi:replication control protein 1 [Coprinopsis cinerea okayama7|uniref:Origin recognition complex subunit 1 n=1 Tax=Coprinopsis cinerea (strain Okayama-7 / 130 / ATCC MYA-4618 / FGSC 9003) TaxID=240176 RepID=A8N5C5_COPC7|nr:replication control protein 1 [Coprinopsis cinerea okayama7\|eukprot:XP_001830070.2 replication control protein 1 [Coprinopsis cinerea okayama7\
MALNALPQTPVRRSKRFQPLATPFLKQAAPAGLECSWDGEPIFTRPCNPDLDLMQEDLDAREDVHGEDAEAEEDNGEGSSRRGKKGEETVFYASFTMKKQRPRQRGRGDNSARDAAQVYRPGDTILVETDVLYRQKRPPSIAVIMSMWEVKKAGEEVSGDPARMRLRVHWFLRPGELPAIRQKRDHVENEIYYSLHSTDILVPTVIVSRCSVSSHTAHIQKTVKATGRSRGYQEIDDSETGEQKFFCRFAINSQRGLYYEWNWDDHHDRAMKTVLAVPDDESSERNTWGQGLEWNVDTTEPRKPKPKPTTKGQPPRKRVKLETEEQEQEASGDEDSGSEADIDSDGEEDDEEFDDVVEEGEEEEGSEEEEDEEDNDFGNPKTPSRRKRKRGQSSTQPKTPRKSRKNIAQPTPHSKAALRKRRRLRDSAADVNSSPRKRLPLRPPTTLPSKSDLSHLPQDPWRRAMHVLHVGNRPDALPCREDEYARVLQCVGDLLEEGSGGCVYISGVPGTGKTATVHTVVRELKRMAEANEINPFTYVEINGLRIPEPSVAYTLLWEAIHAPSGETGMRISAKESLKALTHHFNGRSRGPAAHAYVVLMDELDQLVTAKQDVIYNFFNWPTLAGSNLVVIAVANTMDLPERVMTGRVRSRLGMTRINFQPYTTQQLSEIVRARLESAKEGLKEDAASQVVLTEDAIKLAAVRISRITGDARRVLDVCRRVVENVSATKTAGGPKDVLKVLLHERIMLASLIKCVKREGVEEIKWGDVQYQHINYLGALAGVGESSRKPTSAELAIVLDSLVASRAILLEDGAAVARKPEEERRVLLNIEQIEVERVLSDIGGPAWKNVLSA